MKRTLRPDGKAYKQILGTIPVLQYLISMTETHFGIKKKIEMRYAVIVQKSSERIGKQKVKPVPISSYKYDGRSFRVVFSLEEIPLSRLDTSIPLP